MFCGWGGCDHESAQRHGAGIQAHTRAGCGSSSCVCGQDLLWLLWTLPPSRHSVMIVVAATQHKPLACKLFTGGVLLFSGSLYALVLLEARKLGAITPIGGLLMCAGWLALLV